MDGYVSNLDGWRVGPTPRLFTYYPASHRARLRTSATVLSGKHARFSFEKDPSTQES